MSITELSVVKINGVVAEKLLNETSKLIDNITQKANPKPDEVLLMGDTIIFKGNNKVTEHSRIYITNPKVYRDYVQDFEPNLQKEIVKLKKEFDLNQTAMKELLKGYKADMKNLEGKEVDIHTKLKMLNRRAIKNKADLIEESLIGKFNKKYIEASAVMGEITLNIECFKDESLTEVVQISENLLAKVQFFLEVTKK